MSDFEETFKQQVAATKDEIRKGAEPTIVYRDNIFEPLVAIGEVVVPIDALINAYRELTPPTDAGTLVAWLREGAHELENAHRVLDSANVPRQLVETERASLTLAARIALLVERVEDAEDEIRNLGKQL